MEKRNLCAHIIHALAAHGYCDLMHADMFHRSAVGVCPARSNEVIGVDCRAQYVVCASVLAPATERGQAVGTAIDVAGELIAVFRRSHEGQRLP